MAIINIPPQIEINLWYTLIPTGVGIAWWFFRQYLQLRDSQNKLNEGYEHLKDRVNRLEDNVYKKEK